MKYNFDINAFLAGYFFLANLGGFTINYLLGREIKFIEAI